MTYFLNVIMKNKIVKGFLLKSFYNSYYNFKKIKYKKLCKFSVSNIMNT